MGQRDHGVASSVESVLASLASCTAQISSTTLSPIDALASSLAKQLPATLPSGSSAATSRFAVPEQESSRTASPAGSTRGPSPTPSLEAQSCLFANELLDLLGAAHAHVIPKVSSLVECEVERRVNEALISHGIHAALAPDELISSGGVASCGPLNIRKRAKKGEQLSPNTKPRSAAYQARRAEKAKLKREEDKRALATGM